MLIAVHEKRAESLSLTAFTFVAGVQACTFTVKNNCAYTVRPVIFNDLNVGSAKPNQPAGWEQAAGASVSFSVPDNRKAGRIWGRTDCNFSTNPGPTSCSTGGCNGGLVCNERTDWYDVSLVDGSNIPISVTTNVGCSGASCPTDLNPNCPAELASKDASGKIVGCKSACFANLDGNQANSGNCYSGSHNTPQTCPPNGVQFYDHFRQGCPLAYAYAYDESSGTAPHTCDTAKAAGYTVIICP